MTNREMLSLIWPDWIMSSNICPKNFVKTHFCDPITTRCVACKNQWLDSEYIPKTSSVPETEEEDPQFTREQEERIDEVYSAVLEMCRDFAAGGQREIVDDMQLLGPLADYIAEYLIQNGYEVYFPTQTTDENGKTVICDFYDH